MKNKILRLISSVLILLLLCITTTGATYTEADDDKSWHVTEKVYFGDNYTGYKYQVIPGTDNWPYGDHWKMVEMCQLPIEECKSMSTNQLLDTVVAYPLMGDITAYDDWKTGFEVIKSSFNGLNELLTREDLGSALKDKEKSIRNSRDEFNRENPVSVTKEDTFIPANNDVDYRRMRYAEESSALMYLLMYTGNSVTTEETQTRSYPEYYISLDGNGLNCIGSTSVYTPRGGAMPALIMNAKEIWMFSDGSQRTIIFDDLSPDATTRLNDYFFQTYGLFPESGKGPSVKYNCHSYAWYSSQNSNYWINTPNMYGYSQTTESNVPVGGKVVYCGTYNGGSWGGPIAYVHSALVSAKGYPYFPMSTNGAYISELTSKWGSAGVYKHSISNCPYYFCEMIPLMEPIPYDRKYYY